MLYGAISNEDKIACGYTPAYIYAYGDTQEEMVEERTAVKRYCMEHCLWVMKEVTDVGSRDGFTGLLYSIGSLKDRTETLVIKDIGALGEGYEGLFHRYILGTRGFTDLRTVVPFKDEYKEMMEVFVRKEKEIRTKRIIGVKKKKIEEGHYCGGRLPYGYYVMNKKLFIDKYEGFIVKFIFYRLTQGCSEYGITKELNLRGFHNRANKPFMTGTIHSIVKRKRFYQGYLKTYDGAEVKGDHVPLLLDDDKLVTEEFVKAHFDTEIEKRIANSKFRAKHYDKMTYHVVPYFIEQKNGRINKKKVGRPKISDQPTKKKGRVPQSVKPY